MGHRLAVRGAFVVCAVLASACGGPAGLADGGADTASADAGAAGDAGELDAGVDAGVDAGGDAGSDAGGDTGGDAGIPVESAIAPAGAVTGELPARDGDNALAMPAVGDVVYRIDARAGEHIGFQLTWTPVGGSVVMAALRWNGREARQLGETDGGAGIRTLAVFDPDGERTYWVRVRGLSASARATLRVVRTPFADAPRCTEDCDRLLQLPLPIDPARDGYATDGGTVFRYQFGRRDLVMFVRHAGHTVVAAGMRPFVPYDFSQWDGATPGADTGSLRHASHQRGKDVDISLYGTDGGGQWRSFCTTHAVDGGRACTDGTARDFDGRANARMFAAFYQSGRVTMCFLDAELIEVLRPGAAAAASEGVFDPALLPLFSNGRHVQHWPNHDNHVHVRVSEDPYGAGGGAGSSLEVSDDETVEAP